MPINNTPLTLTGVAAATAILTTLVLLLSFGCAPVCPPCDCDAEEAGEP